MANININVNPAQDAVTVNGVVQQAGRPFTEVVIEAAAAAGTNNFRVSLNGVQLYAMEDAPATTKPGDEIVTTPYDRAG